MITEPGLPPSREELLRRVEVRVEEFGAHRDPAVVLDPAAMDDVARLLEQYPDVEAVAAAAWLHWCRVDVVAEAEQEGELQRAVELFSAIVADAPEQVPPQLLDLLGEHEPGEPWRQNFTRFRDTDDPDALDAAIAALREDVHAAELGAALVLQANLAALLRERALLTTDPNTPDIDESIDLGVNLAGQVPDDDHRAAILSNLASSLLVRFERRGRIADLDKAAQTAERAVAAAASDHPARSIYLANYSAILCDRYRHCGTDDDIPVAVAAAREAVRRPPDGISEHVTALTTLGLALRNAAAISGDPEPLSEAIDAGRRAVHLADANGWADANALINLSQAYLARFELTRLPSDLDDAANTGTAALSVCGPDEPVRVVCLDHLGEVLCTRFEATGHRPDIDAAVQLLDEAASTAHDTNPNAATYQLNLAYALAARHDVTGSPDDLRNVIAACRTALASASPTSADWARGASMLALALHQSYLDGDVPDLDEATTLARAAAQTGRGDRADRGSIASTLSTILQTRYALTADPRDLDDAVAAAQAATAVAHLPRSQAIFRSNLAAALVARFALTGHRSDLDEAVNAARAAVDATHDRDVGLPRRLFNLAAALSSRYETVGTASDLVEAVAAAQQALDSCPGEHPLHPTSAALLSALLHARHLRAGSTGDIDDAVHLASAAVATTPAGSRELAARLANLAAALETRAATPDTPPERVEQDLNAAVSAARAAVEVVVDSERALMLSNLGYTLRRRYTELSDETDLRDAIRVGTEAVARAPAPQPDRTLYLTNLALTFTEAHRHTGLPAAVDEALAYFTEAAGLDTAPVRERLHAAWWGGQLAMSIDRVNSATGLLTAAVGLLPQTAWHGLDRLSREDHLARAQGVGREAAAAALANGLPADATALIELGRALLWERALDTSVHLAHLHDEHPAQAVRLAELRELLG